MRRILILLMLFLSLPALAEEGEFQFFSGAGAYFPLKQFTKDKTVYIYSSYNVPFQVYFGITDNFDIGFNGSFTRLTNTNADTEYNNLSGREYFDYQHVNLNLQLRYNLFPGSIFFAPHIILGAGNNIETYLNREFYLNNDQKYNDFTESDYTTGNFNFQGGIDITSRVWWFFLVKAEAVYNYTMNGTQFVECNVYIGIDWMLKTYGGR